MIALKKIVISVLAVFVGLLLITLITESLEMLIITLTSDKPLSELMEDQAAYFTTRNQPLNIGLKIVYNTMAAFVGGYVCAVIAKHQPVKHCFVLIIIQTLGFIYGMTASEFSTTTPLWLWFVLMILTVIGVWLGGLLRVRKGKSA